MPHETIGRVNYFLSGDYYFVGDNTSRLNDGISDTSYTGPIVIRPEINGKKVIEISKYAFISCSITKVTTFTKMTSTNVKAFC